MPPSRENEVTQLLARVRAERLIPVIYDQLHKLARHHLRNERPDHTLQPTALVNEAWLRLFKPSGEDAAAEMKDRNHFFVVAAGVMRHILVDYARARRASKRDGDRQRVELTDADCHVPEPNIDLIALDQLLDRLAEKHPRAAQVVELKYFGGMTEQEAAEALGISLTTFKREWAFAKGWLYKQLDPNGSKPSCAPPEPR
ncbi:MAG: ECF-type sigma factor [Blastocatellia bacterium]